MGEMTGINEEVTPFSWMMSFNITCQFSPVNRKFNAVPINIPTRIFVELENWL